MKTKRLAAMLAMAGATLCAGERVTAQKATVTVCMDVDQHVLMGVRPLASAMFAGIGIGIDWREPDSCPKGVGAIQVHLSHAPANSNTSSDALAFAQPYQQTIVVFVDRVEQLNRKGVRSAMAHVLVHEITHVLEGVDRHSATGIMKARWSDKDYFEMCRKPLTFADEDVNLIYAGLNASRDALSPALVAAQTKTAYR
jgi:hypothetical protein